MVSIYSGNRINVRPGEPAFDLMSNLCNYFSLGDQDGDDIWLEGQIVDGEFVFNGRLFLKDGNYGTVIDSFPKGPTPEGWTQERRLDADGYRLVDGSGDTIFSYRIDDKICSVDVNLYKANGELAAHAGQGGIVIHTKARFGRNG